MNLMHKSETCPACHQRIKKSRQRSKVDADGVQRLPGKKEICRTKEAWRKRVDELFERENMGGMGESDVWPCAECGRTSCERIDFDPDHIVKRSLKRDDRLSNLQLLGNRNLCGCHEKKHDEFKRKGRVVRPQR